MRLTLSLLILLAGCGTAMAPGHQVWRTRLVYMGEVNVKHPTYQDCERMRKMIEANPDRPNIPDGLVRRVICAPEGL